MIRVLVADDHPIVREGLKQIISDSDDIIVVDEAGNCQEALNKSCKTEYDVILLDVCMPGRSGIEIIKDLKNGAKKSNVLVLSAYPEEQYALSALKSGASGYLVKKSAPEELIAAIKKVSTGRKYISASLAERLAFAIDENEDKKPHEKLSVREFQVMCMLASGRTVKEIAKKLFLSVKTISTHRSRILEKTGMKNNAEIIHYAVKEGLINY